MPNLSFRNVEKASKILLIVSVMPFHVVVNPSNKSPATFVIGANESDKSAQNCVAVSITPPKFSVMNPVALSHPPEIYSPIDAKNLCPSSVNNPHANAPAAAIANPIGEKITPKAPVTPVSNNPPIPVKTPTTPATKAPIPAIAIGIKPPIKPPKNPPPESPPPLTVSFPAIAFSSFNEALL